MIKMFRYLLVTLVGFVLTISCSKNQEKAKQTVSLGDTLNYNFTSITDTIQNWIDSGYYNGASIIIAKDNKIIFEKYFGNYDTTSQAFIASAGKWLAAATVAAVVEEGKLSWDDKVVKWLPEFKNVKGQATLRQLMSHTAGYPDYQPKGGHKDDYQTLEESVKHIVNLTADTLPGTKFKYGGLAMQVAGRMAELAAGKDWETIFQEKIAQPLEMHNTHFIPVDSAAGHSPMVGGGAKSTLHDYAHFLEMILNNGIYRGKAVLAESTIKEMQADQIKGAKVDAKEYVENARNAKHKAIYGIGEWREIINDKGEAVLVSSPSWAGAYPWIDKENNIYGFFLTHVNVEKANKDHFSSFYASPVLPVMVKGIVNKGSK
jgi:CubicO group peptidase (beta-lactamase class C family)